MLERLFIDPAALARHRAAPLLAERERFLDYKAKEGFSLNSMLHTARVLLIVSASPILWQRRVRRADIHRAAQRHRAKVRRMSKGHCDGHYAERSFLHMASTWMAFLGRLTGDKPPRTPFASQVAAYERFMRDDQGLSSATICLRRRIVRQCLETLSSRVDSLREITHRTIDSALVLRSQRGWGRSSLRLATQTLRSFFRYAEAQRWCRSGIAQGIESPRLYVDEGLPRAPPWDAVQAAIRSAVSERPVAMRDHAVFMLLAIYGLRRGEVARLRLDDIDWEADVIRIVRPKQRRIQHYPLIQPVGKALSRYLRKGRPRCISRHVFLCVRAPMRPLSPTRISQIVHEKLTALGVKTSPRGPQSLRHACARQLLASGFSLKQIGDQLGHRRVSTTRHYAKVDMAGLRRVAEIDLRSVL